MYCVRLAVRDILFLLIRHKKTGSSDTPLLRQIKLSLLRSTAFRLVLSHECQCEANKTDRQQTDRQEQTIPSTNGRCPI